MRAARIIQQSIQKLEIQNGEVLLIRRGSPLAQAATLKRIGELFGQSGLERCILLVVDNFDDLKRVSPDSLALLLTSAVPRPGEGVQ